MLKSKTLKIACHLAKICFKATAKVFPPGFHYRPTATNKTRKFYEFILIDTNLVSIKHFKDPKDPNLNTHSTIQILKVM